MTSYTVRTRARGPLFDGVAIHLLQDWSRVTAEELATQARDEIQRRAHLMNKSGRGGTGGAARAVHSYERTPSTWIVRGESREGVVWWPWLEGTSKRNFTTKFKGYHTFRIVKNIIQRRARAVGEAILQRYLPGMGGT